MPKCLRDGSESAKFYHSVLYFTDDQRSVRPASIMMTPRISVRKMHGNPASWIIQFKRLKFPFHCAWLYKYGEKKAAIHTSMTVIAAILAPIPYGSVTPFWVAFWVLLMAATLLIAPVESLNARQCYMIGCIVFLWIIYLGLALVQVLPSPPLLANEVWVEVAEKLGRTLPGRISVRASLPIEAFGRALLAVLAFCNGFVVGARFERLKRLIDAIAIAGLLIALYGIIIEFIAPSRLLFNTKTAYLGDVTGPFVNRNTAATYFGTITTLWFFAVLERLSHIRFYSLKLLLLIHQREDVVRSLVLRMLALAICITALLETHSRGGALAFGFGIFSSTIIALVKYRQIRLLMLCIGAGIIIMVTGVGGSIGIRVESDGLFDRERWMTYYSSWQLVTKHPWLGTGLGTFRDVFPMVRDTAAFARGVWDMAHNTIVEIAVEMGLPAAITIVAGAVWILYCLYKAALAQEGQPGATSLILASIAVLSFVHSLTDFSLQIPGFLLPAAVLIGSGLGLSGNTVEKKQSTLTGESLELNATARLRENSDAIRPGIPI